jgi:probable rRNA maturation factor
MRPVDVLNEDSRLAVAEPSVLKCVAALDDIDTGSVPPGSLGIAFVGEAACSRLHADFFGDPDITDVMTFPGDPEDRHAGDIAICPAVAATAAVESKLPFREELTLYLVHAWLHLAGMEDATPKGRSEMRAAEDRLMQLLRSRDALLEAAWTP